MRRRCFQQDEYPEDRERWLVSYADFITLLFAFFVVMYAISSVSDSKYHVLSNSLSHAFKSSGSNSITPSVHDVPPIILQQPIQIESQSVIDKRIKNQLKQQEIKGMAEDIMRALAPLVEDGTVRVTQSIRGITIEINANVLFSPGKAQLTENSSLTLRAVAQVVKAHDHAIHVEGHTDNVSINTVNFPSNWELSTARASSVIRLLMENGVAAHRLTALGYGEYRPIETNDTDEGRTRNRRVTVMILSEEPERITEIPLSLTPEPELTE